MNFASITNQLFRLAPGRCAQAISYSAALPARQPARGFRWKQIALSLELDPEVMDKAPFKTAIGKITFLGEDRCIVCGDPRSLQHCHIIPQADHNTVRIKYLRDMLMYAHTNNSGSTYEAGIGF